MAAMIFAGGVTILIIGFLWFYIARPMLEDFGLIVNDYEDAAPHVMSRSDVVSPPSAPSSLETDKAQTTDRQPAPAFSRDVMLDTYKLLRKYGVPREEARPVLKAMGMPLDNNVWVTAAPADDDVLVTPYAGRRTRASYYPDEPELEYKSPA